MSSHPATTSDGGGVAAVADAIRSHERFLLVTHENPDGDALGSILGTHIALEQLGKDSVMYLSGTLGLPQEYGFMDLRGLRRDLPDDAAERVLLALDCANAQRTGIAPDDLQRFLLTIDVDHHHDNSRFAGLNLIVPNASSTSEIVRDVLGELGVRLTPEIAEPLYIA